MDKLWAKRKPPKPLDWDSLENEANEVDKVSGGIKDQEAWTLKECRDKFANSVSRLRERLEVMQNYFLPNLTYVKPPCNVVSSYNTNLFS